MDVFFLEISRYKLLERNKISEEYFGKQYVRFDIKTRVITV